MAVTSAPSAKGRRRAAGPLFVAPFMVLFVLLFLAPLGYAAYLSLFQERLIGGTAFVGLDNYVKAVQDPLLIHGVGRVALFFVIQVPVMLLLALLFALALDSGLLRLARVIRLGIFVPYAVPSVVAALMWGYLYGPDFGPFAQLSRKLDLPVPGFLSESWMLGSLANIVTWEFVGYNMIILYAALRTIPQELYEAAAMDGAGCLADRLVRQTPGSQTGVAAHPVVLRHRQFPAVQRTEPADEGRPGRHQQLLHRQPLRLHARLHRPAGQLRGHGVLPPRPRHRDRLLRHPAHREPQEDPVTTTTPTVAATPVATPVPVAPRRRRRSRARRSTSLTIAMLAALAYFLLPLFWLLIASTKSTQDLFNSFGLWFSHAPQLLANVKETFTQDDGVFVHWLLNTVMYAVVSSVGAALLAAAAGYGFAKFRFRGDRLGFNLVLGAVMVPTTALAIPTYLLFAEAGLVNTPWAIILPSLVNPFGLYLMRVYAQDAIPDSILEAARIDGAGEARIFFTIALRLLAPGLVTVLLFTLVATWNNYFLPLIMLKDSDWYPLTLGLSVWNSQAETIGGEVIYNLVITGSLLTIVPLIAAFLLLQKYWQSGLAAGSVKE